MRAVFFVSSIGDANLAIDTIRALENSGHQIALISLTEAVDKHIKTFSSSALIHKSSINELLSTPAGTSCNLTQLSEIIAFIKSKDYQQVFIGVPSANNLEIPFQIAELLDDVPVLMTYEYMFKPEPHVLWSYFSRLENKTHIQWALPLDEALKDFDTRSRKHIVGHLSIDNAFTSSPASVKTQEEVLKALKIDENQKLSFISGTTQPTEIDASFIDCLLEELKKHPSMQVRIGLHPGIKDFDSYIADILVVCKKYSRISSQFKIILPDILIDRFTKPELSINHSDYACLFLKVNITGAEAANAATHVAQAVPGALLNEAALKGKPVCYKFGKAYLPPDYFSNSHDFFSAIPKVARMRSELSLGDKTAPEACAQILMDTQDELSATVTRNGLASISK